MSCAHGVVGTTCVWLLCNTVGMKCMCAGGKISCSGCAELLREPARGHHDTLTDPTPGRTSGSGAHLVTYGAFCQDVSRCYLRF